MRIRILILTTSFCVGHLFAQNRFPEQSASQENAESANVLDDIIIEGTYEALFEEEKPPIDLQLDFSDVVQFDDGMNWDSIDEILPGELQESCQGLESHLSTPEMVSIIPAPVKVFTAQFEKIRRWKLEITSIDGTVFRSIGGEGSPPARIDWDGLSDTGEVLTAGQNYAYNFVAVDKAGNRRIFPGKTFKVDAFYLTPGDSLLIGLDPQLLFDETTLRSTLQAKVYAREVASLIRYYSAAGKITVLSSGANIGEFLDLVSSDLIIDPQAISQPGSKGKSVMFIVE